MRCLVRRGEGGADSIPWDPANRVLAPEALASSDAIINLAGENVSAGHWNRPRREAILRSRINATATLVCAMQQIRPRPAVLVNASAIGVYGDRREETLTEASAPGIGFLPEVCGAWEAEAVRATELGVRVVCLRFGLVLARDGGALSKMLPLFRLGLGGRLGSGRQWMGWVHRDDAIGVINAALTEPLYAGPFNVVAPEPIRNAGFAAALGRAVRRPAVVPAPAFALRLAFGAMADEALLASTRAVPAKLEGLGFAFAFPTLDTALRDLLGQK